MAYDLLHRSCGQDAVLDGIIEAARRVGARGVVGLDLDGCLFDNRPRQVRIVRSWAERAGETRLAGLRPEHFQDWSLAATFGRLGLDAEEAEALARRVRRHWGRWFFDDAFVIHDLPLPGAPRFVRALEETGVRLAYVTGRPTRQSRGTLAALELYGFPSDPELLWANPGGEGDDASWKRRALAELTQTHELVAFLDNEPLHVLHAIETYPSAAAVWMRTDHSPRLADLPPHVLELRGYLRTTDARVG